MEGISPLRQAQDRNDSWENMWFYLILASGLIFTIRTIWGRLILREEKDLLAYNLSQQGILALLILPIALWGWQTPANKIVFIYLILLGVWDVLSIFLYTKSESYLEVSLRTIVYQSRMVWMVFLGYLLLGETLNWQKLAGGFLIFGGVVLVTWQKNRISRLKLLWKRLRNHQSTDREKGILLTAAASLSISLQLLIEKLLLDWVTPAMLILFLSGTSALIYGLLVKDLRRLVRLPRLTLWQGLLHPVGAWLFWTGTAMTEVTKTAPITGSFAVLAVLLGIVFLKERERVWQKILGSLVAVAGVILVKIS